MTETLTEKQRVLFSMLNNSRYPGGQIIPRAEPRPTAMQEKSR